MKQTFQRMYDNGDIHPQIKRSGGKVEIVDCTTGSSYLGSDSFDDSTYQIANLAYEVVRLRRLFSALGYPERVWQPLLIEFEQGQMRWALQKGKSTGGWETPPEQRHAFETCVGDQGLPRLRQLHDPRRYVYRVAE